MFIYGDLKSPNEEGYDPAVHKVNVDDEINEENIKTVVESIFTKAQNEKQYCAFYGDLVEKMIKLELNFRGMTFTIRMLRNSKFREQLLAYCKTSFE